METVVLFFFFYSWCSDRFLQKLMTLNHSGVFLVKL
jgi:hypothetical protein